MRRRKVFQDPPSFFKCKLSLLEPRPCLAASVDGHCKQSGGRVPRSLAVKRFWKDRSKGNQWQETKSQGVEFCESVGESANGSLL